MTPANPKVPAIYTLIEIALSQLDSMPRAKQIRTLKAIAELAPTPAERRVAARIAFSLEEASKMQSEFIGMLFPADKPRTGDGQ